MDPALRDHVRQPISTTELERRWAATREAMSFQGIDCLVMQNSNQHLGGYVRWFTDIPTQNGYPQTVVFPVNDEMTIISSGGPPLPPTPPTWAVRGVKERVGRPYFRTLNYTNTMDAEEVVSRLEARGAKKVGLVGLGSMAAATYQYIREKLRGAELVDATDLVDAIKAIKSPEEIEIVKKVVSLQDAAWSALPALVRPGKKEYEVLSALIHLMADMGSEEQLMVMSSAPAGTPAGHRGSYYAHRTLQSRDQLFVMIEVNGPGGMYAELGRTLCLDEAPQELLKVWEVAKEAQKRTVERLVPGANPAELFKAHNEYMVSRGFAPEGRLYGHAQGYDLIERPALRAEETIPIAANMNITVHPIAFTDKAYAFCCDNYLVGEKGAVRLHKTPQEIFVV